VKPFPRVSGKLKRKVLQEKKRENTQSTQLNNPHVHLFELSIDILSVARYDGTIKDVIPPLDLYIAKSFMRLQDGDLTVSSVMGKGSAFTFGFPKSNGASLTHQNK
jgi:hypothetical protein